MSGAAMIPRSLVIFATTLFRVARQCASPLAFTDKAIAQVIASTCQFHIPHCETRETDRFIAQALPTFVGDDMILTR